MFRNGLDFNFHRKPAVRYYFYYYIVIPADTLLFRVQYYYIGRKEDIFFPSFFHTNLYGDVTRRFVYIFFSLSYYTRVSEMAKEQSVLSRSDAADSGRNRSNMYTHFVYTAIVIPRLTENRVFPSFCAIYCYLYHGVNIYYDVFDQNDQRSRLDRFV